MLGGPIGSVMLRRAREEQSHQRVLELQPSIWWWRFSTSLRLDVLFCDPRISFATRSARTLSSPVARHTAIGHPPPLTLDIQLEANRFSSAQRPLSASIHQPNSRKKSGRYPSRGDLQPKRLGAEVLTSAHAGST
jgi:hypothetical protein